MAKYARNRSDEQRFMDMVTIIGDYWKWCGSSSAIYCKKLYSVRRVAWMLFVKKEVPKGYRVASKSNEDTCVNPEKLYLEKIKKKPNLLRFRINKDTGCWLWVTGNARKHPIIYYDGRMHLAHKVFYLKHKGDVPSNRMVLHSCGIANCVNPKHLYLGDAKQNYIDSVRHGTAIMGERTWSAVLTEDEVRSIRRYKDRGVKRSEVFKIFKDKINYSGFLKVWYNERWKHIK